MKPFIKQISYWLGILACSWTMYSCSESFLDVPPQNEQTPEDKLSTNEAAAQVVNAIYNKLLDWNQHTFAWIGITSITSDDADKGSVPGDTGTDKNLLDNFTFSVDAVSFNEVWVANYQGIARANQALKVIPDFTIEERVKNRLMGEARFLRAYFYFNLVRSFGGVPLIEKIPDPTNTQELEQARTRASKEQIYQLIINDLQFAIENLYPKSELGPEDVGRATVGAAKTFLAKVNMYLNNWSEVSRLTNEVISSGEYALVDDYATIWREVGENSVESIFEVQGRGDTPNKGLQGYTATQGVRGQFGWGFNTPTEDLANTYEVGDTRKEATIIFPGETLWDGVEIITDVPNPYYNQKAYISRVQETFNGNDWESNKNLRVFRFAEVLLMNAEAANELGMDALTSLNLVRDRAKLAPVNETDPNKLRKIIWHERRVELAFEHDRFFDLVRQGRAGEVLRAHGKNFVDGKHELFPIPQSQINLSEGKLLQNPGY
ncbi:RagB/SusD family nutrient uptake outer membrane protein [Rapidithrix thailandica]|uniref:RagB/SusD family nutrient uptake outer membrane protein n=1 Tax=Rapidithrix thailandica TaxID=413964 RepID=A0AAW9SEK5_9BACT